MAESPSSPTSASGACGGSAHHHTRSLSTSLRSMQERRARDAERSGQDDDVRAWLAAQLKSPKYLSKAVPLQSLLKDGVDLCLFASTHPYPFFCSPLSAVSLTVTPCCSHLSTPEWSRRT